MLNAIATTHEPGGGLENHIDWAQQFYAEIEPSLTGGAYINFLSSEGKDRVQAAYGTEKFARLRAPTCAPPRLASPTTSAPAHTGDA